MKMSLNVEADAIAVTALNGGRMAVDIDGVAIETLLNIINDSGCTLRVASTPGQIMIEPATTRLAGIQCSTAHITEADNQLLHKLSQQSQEYGEGEWIFYTGSGYLLRLDAWQYPVLRLKRLGLSKAARRLLVTLTHRDAINLIHFDALGELLPGVQTFNW
jgi:hypothetical protein